MKTVLSHLLCALCVLCVPAFSQEKKELPLPTSKVLLTPAPGAPQRTNSFPVTMAVSPDQKYLTLLNDGYGVAESGGRQSIAVLEVATSRITDFPDARLGQKARQTYFLGLAFSGDGKHLYASIASITDPEGKEKGSTGNGIAVYAFENGRITPERFIPIPLQQLAKGKKSSKVWSKLPDDQAVPYPAGLAVVSSKEGERLLVADNLSDDALLLDVASGKIIFRFDLSVSEHVPASYPYDVVADERLGRAWVSLWNASRVAELDLNSGQVTRMIPLRAPKSRADAGSHPGKMTVSPGKTVVHVTLSNRDEVAVIHAGSGEVIQYLSARLPKQKHSGTFPTGVAERGDLLFVANASSNSVGVFKIETHSDAALVDACPGCSFKARKRPLGFLPTEWYPTALAVVGDELFIATGKAQGTGPNSAPLKPGQDPRKSHAYIASLLHGSLARVKINEIATQEKLKPFTEEVLRSNLMREKSPLALNADLPLDTIRFAHRGNPIKHVIYIIKENRSYDQVFGDIKGANGDPSLVMFGEDITPNQHKLARQFGVLDNFYDAGEISGNGHVWSNAAITSDYTEQTWQIGYRGRERTYDYEGIVANAVPLEQGIADVNEPGSGYLWTNLARRHKTYRHYGEYVTTKWCNEVVREAQSPTEGTPLLPGAACPRTYVKPGEPVAQPPSAVRDCAGGGACATTLSQYQWPVPIIAGNTPTKLELRDHFDPDYADFRLEYPDQLRADEFLREFAAFVRNGRLPQFITLRLPNDHTAGTKKDNPTPEAAVADNDLALGRVVEAVSHSPYWDSIAIFVLEDDAQNGADHVDAHRSIALAISKYAPQRCTAAGGCATPFVDRHFYTTVNMIHTMESLLGLPPMNNNDARAPLMSPLFSGAGTQPAFSADYRNRDNGLIYQANQANAKGSRESAELDFSHADAADTAVLNAVLWRARKGDVPMPPPVHTMCGQAENTEASRDRDEN